MDSGPESIHIDMDKVPPLRTGVSAASSQGAPLSSRSGSSSATPRTGGGTARSSDGKGTPRDAERLPLGALRSSLPGEAWPAQAAAANAPQTPRPCGSPLTTARSGAVSSTPSSEADGLSSRSRGDSWYQDPPSGRRGGYERDDRGGHAEPADEAARPSWCSDLSREIEVMRHVILKENVRLNDQIRGLEESCLQLRRHVEPGAVGALVSGGAAGEGPLAATSPAGDARWLEAAPVVGGAVPCHRRRTVEWRLRAVDGSRAGERGERDRSSFELPEYPEVAFVMTFGAGRREKVAESDAGASGQRWPCRLSLSAKGPGLSGLCILVALEALEEPPADEGSAEACGAIVRLGVVSGTLLHGGGRTGCPCAWPTRPRATVVCRARIELVGHCVNGSPPLQLDTGPSGRTDSMTPVQARMI